MPFPDDQTIALMTESDRRHASGASVSFEVYRRQRYDALNAFMRHRKSIYLDMNYWIWLRDPARCPFPDQAQALWATITDAVQRQRVVCPVSYPVFLELMRLNPISLRQEQAKLMDDLSCGTGIRNGFDMAEIEFSEFFIRNSANLRAIPFRIDSVWCPLGHMIVEKYPYQSELSHELMERGRKVMLDVRWNRTMQDYAAVLDLPDVPRTSASQINQERQAHPRAGKSFRALFFDELNGALDVMFPHIENTLASLAAAIGIRPSAEELASHAIPRHVWINLFREAVNAGLDATAIPSLRVRAALHAAIRMDDRRPFQQNDIEDISHSSVALSYCDLFLTERSFTEMLNRPVVRAAIAPTQCRVVSNIEEAVSALAKFAQADSAEK
jgi:hypothetical protein